MQSFDAPVAPPPPPEPPPPPPPEPPSAPEVEAEVEVEADVDIHLPTAEDIERIHDQARKEGYDAGYEEGTARGRVEALQLHGLVEGLDAALTRLDADVAEELLALAIEVARQMVRESLVVNSEALLGMIREALLQLPQSHAMVHLHPDDYAIVHDYLGEQLTHAGHRLVADATLARGGARIEAAGSQIDASVQTRWRRIMDNLGRSVPWDAEA